jgi:hypothetical protein
VFDMKGRGSLLRCLLWDSTIRSQNFQDLSQPFENLGFSSEILLIFLIRDFFVPSIAGTKVRHLGEFLVCHAHGKVTQTKALFHL